LANATGRHPLGVKALRQLRDRALEALRDRGEVQLVAGDQRRIGFGTEILRELKCTRRQDSPHRFGT
jgi:hypothetical protein